MQINTDSELTSLQKQGIAAILNSGYNIELIQDSDVFEGELMVWLDSEEVCAHINASGEVDYS
tara:strand:- start:777 stop:965 length:189 start_codon:yes stop_codon:yes gene_type:complete